MTTRQESRQPICEACGSASVVQLRVELPQSMRSDGLVVQESLKKFHCEICGTASGKNTQPCVPYLRSDGSSIFDLRRHHSIARGMAKLIEKYERSESPKVLEVGAASFETALQLKKLNPEARIAAIDSSPERSISSGVIDTIIDDFSSYDFDVLFDVIFSNNVIEHMADTRKFISRCSQYLKQSGTLIICCPTFSPAGNELLFADHLFHFTPSGLSACCEGSGLQIVDHHTSGWDHLTHVYILRRCVNAVAPRLEGVDSERLFQKRQFHLRNWAMQDEAVLGRLGDDMPTLLYGAGEFSQLIRAYLPGTYARIDAITVDDLTGSREFDKPKVDLESIDPRTGQMIIGAHPASRMAVKEKLLRFGYPEDRIFNLSV